MTLRSGGAWMIRHAFNCPYNQLTLTETNPRMEKQESRAAKRMSLEFTDIERAVILNYNL